MSTTYDNFTRNRRQGTVSVRAVQERSVFAPDPADAPFGRSVAGALRRAVEAAGLDLARLAADAGMDARELAACEADPASWPVATFARIAEAAGVKASELFAQAEVEVGAVVDLGADVAAASGLSDSWAQTDPARAEVAVVVGYLAAGDADLVRAALAFARAEVVR
ncbi:MAG: helix-turn-helix domain-containing protein [Cellulomonas sp.]|nr:helix-turn-helix domain-containing protein [Cellulomonas sp.]